MENNIDNLAQAIYIQLVVREFYEDDSLGYKTIKAKAYDAAKAFFEE